MRAFRCLTHSLVFLWYSVDEKNNHINSMKTFMNSILLQFYKMHLCSLNFSIKLWDLDLHDTYFLSQQAYAICMILGSLTVNRCTCMMNSIALRSAIGLRTECNRVKNLFQKGCNLKRMAFASLIAQCLLL